MALSEASRTARYLKYWLKEVKCLNGSYVEIMEDSSPTIRAVHNDLSSIKHRHLKLRYYFILQSCEDTDVVLRKISTNKQVADMLTKQLAIGQFRALRSVVFGVIPLPRDQ
eukprot:1337736-Prorocentrum_lima.AAC.1